MADPIEETLGKLTEVVQGSDLSDDDMNLWYTAFAKMNDESLMFLWFAWEKEPPDMSQMTEQLKRKIEALKNPSSGQWEEIIKEEKEILNSMVP